MEDTYTTSKQASRGVTETDGRGSAAMLTAAYATGVKLQLQSAGHW